VVQLTTVLQHLARHRPEWDIDVWAGRGKESACRGLCRRTWNDHGPQPDWRDYEKIFDLAWPECDKPYSDSPSTKACRCLREVFGITPEVDLLGYRIDVTAESRRRCGEYLAGIGCVRRPDDRFNAVAIHYEGNTSPRKKNLDHGTIDYLCRTLLAADCVPVILDWDRRSPLPDGRTIHCPGVGADDLWGGFGSGDAERLAALLAQCRLAIAIDSGPQKVAGATATPMVAVWTQHHPAHFFDLCPNVVHLVPENVHELCARRDERIQQYFRNHYRHELYALDQLAARLADLALRTLSSADREGSATLRGFCLHAERPEQDWVIIEDVYVRDCYKTALLPKRNDTEYVLDVGAHIGTFARLWHERNPAARIVCVEACPENIPLLRRNVGAFAKVIHAACTYETGDLTFLNSVTSPTGRSTGGSTLTDSRPPTIDAQFRVDDRTLPRLTIHEILERFHWPHVDLLKLDCEGSEFSILGNAPIEKIGFILGEYHGFERWESFRAHRFPGWSYGHMSRSGEMGNFHLRNPGFQQSI
jgi:FkbM family methyltransferase